MSVKRARNDGDVEEKYLGITVHYQHNNSSYTVFCKREVNWFSDWFDVAFHEPTGVCSICIPEDLHLKSLLSALAVQVYGVEVAGKFRSKYNNLELDGDRVQRYKIIDGMVEDIDLPLRQEGAFMPVLYTEPGRLRHYFVFYM